MKDIAAEQSPALSHRRGVLQLVPLYRSAACTDVAGGE